MTLTPIQCEPMMEQNPPIAESSALFAVKLEQLDDSDHYHSLPSQKAFNRASTIWGATNTGISTSAATF